MNDNKRSLYGKYIYIFYSNEFVSFNKKNKK